MSEIQSPPNLPITIKFRGNCAHTQEVKNPDEVYIEPNTWFYCRKCRTFRIIADYSTDSKKLHMVN